METLFSAPEFILFARLALGGVFVLSAATKLWDRTGDAAFANRAWLPPGVARRAARGLPWLEAVVGVLLVLGGEIRLAALGAVALLILFTVVVIADLRQGRGMPCHCFGRLSREPAGLGTVVRNLVLLAGAGLLAWHPNPYLAFDGLTGGGPAGSSPALVDAVPIFFLALAVVIFVVLGETLLATIRSFLRAF